jgi:hypothetical protein
MRESPGPTGTGHDLAHIRNLSSVFHRCRAEPDKNPEPDRVPAINRIEIARLDRIRDGPAERELPRAVAHRHSPDME